MNETKRQGFGIVAQASLYHMPWASGITCGSLLALIDSGPTNTFDETVLYEPASVVLLTVGY